MRIIRMGLGMLFLASVFAFTPAKETDLKGGGSENFQLLGHSFEGEALVINYFVPFPGMTKVRLYNSGLEMLWKGQYVDDFKGEHQVRLRAGKLVPGKTYLFEFDYKGNIQRLPVTAP